ncbi:hypothetical protein HZB01_02350 [Candidatus Woesearchaeota archaeon]|nr:hypothetical protein [Candidatus Woesearchaeota archaeon]
MDKGSLEDIADAMLRIPGQPDTLWSMYMVLPPIEVPEESARVWAAVRAAKEVTLKATQKLRYFRETDTIYSFNPDLTQHLQTFAGYVGRSAIVNGWKTTSITALGQTTHYLQFVSPDPTMVTDVMLALAKESPLETYAFDAGWQKTEQCRLASVDDQLFAFHQLSPEFSVMPRGLIVNLPDARYHTNADIVKEMSENLREKILNKFGLDYSVVFDYGTKNYHVHRRDGKTKLSFTRTEATLFAGFTLYVSRDGIEQFEGDAFAGLLLSEIAAIIKGQTLYYREF